MGTTNIYYDVQGNVSQRGSQAFVFDEANRLTAATNKASYRYDGLGRRTVINAADGSTSVQFYSSAGQILYSTIVGGSSGSGSATRYIYLAQRLIAETKLVGGAATNSTRYIHTDGLGSPVAHTDSAGTVVDRSRYEAYGANVNIGGSTNPVGVGFTGHVNDIDTGLVYMQQRYYDPVAGRFLSTDQVLTDTSSGASFNRYVYTSNNPYRYTDPDGRFVFLVPIVVATAEIVTDAVIAYGARTLFVASAAAAANWGANAISNETAEVPAPASSNVPNGKNSSSGGEKTNPPDGQRPSKTPNTGVPGSTVINPGSGQERTYGPDGKPMTDIDRDHDHGQGVPHQHDWVDGKRGPGVPVKPPPPPPRPTPQSEPKLN